MSLDIESRAQERENVDPEETIRPIPLAAAVVTLVMVVFGVLYIFFSEPLANSQWGDQRTLADLSGPRLDRAALLQHQRLHAQPAAVSGAFRSRIARETP